MVKIIIGSGHYIITNPVIQLENLEIDLTKAKEFEESGKLSHIGEIARLFLEIYGHNGYKKTLFDGTVINVKKREGIDLRTATDKEIKKYLSNNSIKKSEAMEKICTWIYSKKKNPNLKNPDIKNLVDIGIKKND